MSVVKALITGITGQDRGYLAEFLLDKGYSVHGVKRRASSFNTDRIDHPYQDPHERDVRLNLHYGDLTDSTNLIRIIQEVQPDKIQAALKSGHLGDGLKPRGSAESAPAARGNSADRNYWYSTRTNPTGRRASCSTPRGSPRWGGSPRSACGRASSAPMPGSSNMCRKRA